jgi:DNA-binding MarR family transcriptional regulator
MVSQVDYLEIFNNLIVPTINKIQRLSSATLEKALQSHDMTLAEFRIVGLLIGEEKGFSQKQLAKQLGISPPSLSVSIAQLEKKKTIQRISDKDDQRIKRIRVSPHVDLKEIGELIMEFEIAATQGISAKELKTTKRVLMQIIQNVGP